MAWKVKRLALLGEDKRGQESRLLSRLSGSTGHTPVFGFTWSGARNTGPPCNTSLTAALGDTCQSYLMPAPEVWTQPIFPPKPWLCAGRHPHHGQPLAVVLRRDLEPEGEDAGTSGEARGPPRSMHSPARYFIPSTSSGEEGLGVTRPVPRSRTCS